jgi:hypothetical protein
LDQAEKLYKQLVPIRRQRFGQDNPLTLTTMLQLADVCASEGKIAAADPVYRELLRVTSKRVPAPDKFDCKLMLNHYARFLRATGRELDARECDDRAAKL